MRENTRVMEQEAAAGLAAPLSRRNVLGKAAYVVPAVVALGVLRTEVAWGQSGTQPKRPNPPKPATDVPRPRTDGTGPAEHVSSDAIADVAVIGADDDVVGEPAAPSDRIAAAPAGADGGDDDLGGAVTYGGGGGDVPDGASGGTSGGPAAVTLPRTGAGAGAAADGGVIRSGVIRSAAGLAAILGGAARRRRRT